MATPSNILAWKILLDRETRQATVYGVVELDMTEQVGMPICFAFFYALSLAS